ncbi:hypothetical protein SAMN03159284_02813 [Mucilaginibacter sp. NFR10]|nr:hypothetical protein SAMN03159284_02813 [Mucilaginibacter sp. NFR10]
MLYNIKPAFAGFTFLKRFFSDRAMFTIYEAQLRWPAPDPPRWRVWPACYSTSSQNSRSFIPANGLSFQLNLVLITPHSRLSLPRKGVCANTLNKNTRHTSPSK